MYGPSYARRSITVDRFGHDPLLRKIWELLTDKVCVNLVRIDEDMITGKQACKTVISLLQLRAATSEEIHKLFGQLLTATRPKPSSLAAGKNNTIVIFVSHYLYIE